jgi:hypothetical protein
MTNDVLTNFFLRTSYLVLRTFFSSFVVLFKGNINRKAGFIKTAVYLHLINLNKHTL